MFLLQKQTLMNLTWLLAKSETNMDSKNKVGSPDRDRINVNENYEVEYWTKELRVSAEELKAAVTAVGTSADKVREYVKK